MHGFKNVKIQNPCTAFHQNWSINMESKGTNSLTPLRTVQTVTIPIFTNLKLPRQLL